MRVAYSEFLRERARTEAEESKVSPVNSGRLISRKFEKSIHSCSVYRTRYRTKLRTVLTWLACYRNTRDQNYDV